MITFSTIPKINLARDPFWVTLRTSLFKQADGATQAGSFYLTALPVLGNTITWKFGSETIIFAVVENPDDSGTQLRAPFVNELIVAYLETAILPVFKSNKIANQNFRFWSNMTFSGGMTAYLKYEAREEKSFSPFSFSFNNFPAIHLHEENGTKASYLENFKINVELVDAGTDKTIGTYRAYEPNSLGEITLNYSIFIEGLVEQSFDYFSTLPKRLTQDIYNYKFRVWESYGIGDTAVTKQLYNSNTFFVIEGETSWLDQAKRHENGLDWFTFFKTTKKFLNASPDNLWVLPKQKILLKYLHFSDSPSASFIIEKASGALITMNITGMSKNTLWQLPIDFSLIDEEQVKVYVKDAYSNVISEVKTYNIDRKYYNNVRYFFFANALGGFDTIQATGIGKVSDKLNRTFAKRALPQNFISTDRESITVSVNSNPEFIQNLGFLNQYSNNIEASANYIRQLLASRNIYELIAGRIIPIKLTSTSQDLLEDLDFLPDNYEIKYQRSFEEKSAPTPIITGGTYTEEYNNTYEGGSN